MKKFILSWTLLLGLTSILYAQNAAEPAGVAIYPSHWWVGMKNPHLQLMIHAPGIAQQVQARTIQGEGTWIADGIRLRKITRLVSPNYIFVDLVIAPDARPGTRVLALGGPRTYNIRFALHARRQGNGITYARGITAADLIYLIMPDRFSNGDESNDKIAEMRDTSSDRRNPFLRHGGDLQGINNHLDYLKDLGVTALWLTPVVENDQALTNEGGALRSAYHGYAFTNQYQIDRRLGGNEAYKKLVTAAHAEGIKIIQDAVYNHFGNKHFLFLDPPAPDWFNQWPRYTNTSYRDQPLMDPYASRYDRDVAVNGWFTPFMPDVNQRNPFVANFLIQYALWAVEEFGIDGWRVDTYFYSDRDFLNRINQALYLEFPHITVFGETTTHSVTEQAYFAANNLDVAWKSNLQGVTDYEWNGAALAAMTEPYGGEGGVNRLYNKLVQDILYQDPMRNEIFLDNHDQNRFYSVVGEDFDKYKMGIALLLTQRGIPQLYYGTEILMKNFKNPSDAEVRRDFPGGWKQDSINKFQASGRTPQEEEAYQYVKKLAHFRQGASAIKSGRMMQFVPSGDVYVYFRYDRHQTLMCIMNIANDEKSVDWSRYAERTVGYSRASNVMDGTVHLIGQPLLVPKHQLWILELQ